MNLFYLIIFFILGLLMGSFYTVIGYRLPKDESFMIGHSHCDKCGHILHFIDMVPILSYLFLKGKCRYCKEKISSLSTWMEFFSGVLFALSYYVFGFSYELLFALGISSILVILSITDLSYMIIPDEVLIFFGVYFIILTLLEKGLIQTLLSIASGIVLFVIMYLIMVIGNAIFQKETLGGGDIKLMLVVGMVLPPITGIVSIFLGSLLALPISFLILLKNNEHLIPFGPFLLISFAILYFTGINDSMILNYLRLFY